MLGNYSKEKVHNEIEICSVTDHETKQKIEKILLKESISFYIRWEKRGLFARLFSVGQDTEIVCVNEMQKEEAERCIKELEERDHIQVEFKEKPVKKIYF